MTLEKLSKRISTKEIDQLMLIYLRAQLEYSYIGVKGNVIVNSRPKELKYQTISGVLNLTYSQVRDSMDRLVKQKQIQKYNAWSGQNARKNFYRMTQLEPSQK